VGLKNVRSWEQRLQEVKGGAGAKLEGGILEEFKRTQGDAGQVRELFRREGNLLCQKSEIYFVRVG